MRRFTTISTSIEICEGITLGDILAAEEPTELETMVAEAINNVIQKNKKLRITIHHYMCGLTEREISKRLRLTHTTVGYHLRELRRRFKEEMMFLMSEKEDSNE